VSAVPPPIVGLSVSEPAEDELVRLGLSELHVRHAFIELARHVLAAGWSIAYGGDFRKQGYTEALLDLVRTYDRKDLEGSKRMVSYLAWPLWLDLQPAEKAAIRSIAALEEVAPPERAPERLPDVKQRGPDDLLWGSRSLTAMREHMTAGIDARLVLGGRVSGQQGLLPGIVEEAELALRAGVPLYVAGGFGGAARAIGAALEGASPPELTVEYQEAHTPRYAELLSAARVAGGEPDFEAVVRTFALSGTGGLRNGLDEDENRRLATTDNVDEVVTLFLRGVRSVLERRP